MERKIGEIFEFEGINVVVNESVREFNKRCKDCYFNFSNCSMIEDFVGVCSSDIRKDGKNIVFAEIK